MSDDFEVGGHMRRATMEDFIAATTKPNPGLSLNRRKSPHVQFNGDAFKLLKVAVTPDPGCPDYQMLLYDARKSLLSTLQWPEDALDNVLWSRIKQLSGDRDLNEAIQVSSFSAALEAL